MVVTPGTWRRAVLVVPAAMLASHALLLTSGSMPGATPAYAAAAVVAPAVTTVPAQPDDKQLALDTLDEVVRGNFTAVSARFDESVRQEASPEFLAKSWKDYQETFGRYQSHGDPEQVETGSGVVVNVPLRMAKQPGEFRVTFNEDGRLMGLYFLRAGVPVPQIVDSLR